MRSGRKSMLIRRALLFSLFIITLILALQPNIPHKASGASTYYVASLDADIDAGSQDFVTTSITDAKTGGANVLILVLNTFGGNGNNMDNIIQAISNYETAGNTFITLVAPTNSHAFSAGAFIAEASNQIYMVNGTVIGSATPVLPLGSDPTTLTKDINGFATYMAAITNAHGRNGTAAAQMVTNGVSYTETQALDLNVITNKTSSLTVRGSLAYLGVPNAQDITIHTPGIRSTFLSVLTDPNLDAILFLLGVFAILIDLFHPTLILSVIGATALVLALLGLGVFGASIVSIILMIIGALFIFLEIKIHHGIAALIGVVIFIIGFLLVFQLPPPPPSPEQPTGTFVPIGAITYALLITIGGTVVIGSLYLYRVRETLMHRPPTINPKAIIGKEGRMKTDLTAGGVATALVGAEEWTVTSTTDLAKGTTVIVKDLQGLKLVVEKKEAP
jgi:membrane-bound serine protease (ClpP class)